MTADPSLLDRLRNYLTRHTELDSERWQSDFVWPVAYQALREGFPSFEWLYAAATPEPHLFGIRRLVAQAPFRLSDLRARGYRTQSVRHPVRPPIRGTVEHYLIARLLAPERAVVYLCMYATPGRWYVLDEHRLERA